uniref:Fbxl20, putative n=1 Tax=Parasteatoda tepidariorum TaxID=114398 RepID=A0A2L2YRI9_PARTP
MKITRKHKAESYKTPEEEGLISKLPTNLLKKVFSKLDFSSFIRCPFVSRTDHIENFERTGTGTLSDFSLRKNPNVTDEDIQAYLNVTNNITKLDLYGCKNLTDKSCEKLVISCSSLVKLDIGSCQFTDKSLKAISKYCGNLEYINISWNDKITDDGVAALAQGCRILETFMCKGCSVISDAALQNLAFLCPYIKVINLGFMDITDETVTCISNNCILLQHLCLENCRNLTDASLFALAKRCKNLKILEVARCSKFTDDGFEALATNCPFLEKMDLEDCVLITDKTLNCLATGCPRLQVLSLSSCKLITDEGVNRLSQGACAISSLTMLALDNLPFLTDQCIDYLLCMKKLEKVELFDCGLITTNGMAKLDNHPSQKLKIHAFYKPIPKNNFNSWCFLYSDVIMVVIFVLILISCLILVTLTYGYFTFFNYFSR